MSGSYLIVGAGFTGGRVARILADRGDRVIATTRAPEFLEPLSEAGVRVVRFEIESSEDRRRIAELVRPGIRVLHSLPALKTDGGLIDPTPLLLEVLGDRPSRVVYIGSTGVYGDAERVDEKTPPRPVSPRQQVRLEAEERVQAGPWSTLVLRSAAIYGPGRGVHVAVREGRYRLAGDGRNVISRIHVDDLAALAVAALDSRLTGPFPVADDEPAREREIAAFCASLLGLPMPPSAPAEEVPETLRSSRRVDGGAIRRALGVPLRHPSFRSGIPASLA